MAAKKRQHEEHENEERWLITYADMITLLMVFFIVMYSMANTDLKKFAEVARSLAAGFNLGIGTSAGALIGTNSGGGAATFFKRLPAKQRDFALMTAELSAFASEAGMLGEISVNMTMEGIIISLSNALLFEPGSAELRPESAQTLHKVAEVLNTTDHPVRIEGHTDNIPTNNPLYPTNWELSVARAVSIVRYLIEKENVSPTRLSAAGFAEFKPKVANDSRANRAINRRADIVILYPEQGRKFMLGTPAHEATPTPTTAAAIGRLD